MRDAFRAQFSAAALGLQGSGWGFLAYEPIGGNLVIDGALTLGEFVQFYLYLTLLMGPFRMLGTLVGIYETGSNVEDGGAVITLE